MTRPLALLCCAALFSGCASTLPPDTRTALDGAAQALDAQLSPAGQLAATAVLIRERTGAFPTTRFELLGSPVAVETGARRLSLSHLSVEPTGGGVEIGFTLLPTAADPSDRSGRLALTERLAGDDCYTAGVSLRRTADPDFGGRPLPLVQEEDVRVRRADGRFCVDVERAAAQAAEGEAGDLPLDGPTYTITFTPASGAAPPELAAGYTVTVSD